jgi:hypothetical protein
MEMPARLMDAQGSLNVGWSVTLIGKRDEKIE